MMQIDDTLRARLSAYLDGELSPEEAHEIERLVETEPDIATEFEALTATDTAIRDAFDDMLREPVPLTLARAIDGPSAANIPAEPRRWGFGSIAAGIALLVLGTGIGGLAGYSLAPTGVQVAQTDWLDDVAGYHRLYSAESRHLTEVPATEVAHIETWIGDRTGVPFSVPDLADQGLTFEGARLLVAASRPVAQLMYTTDAGEVYALCFVQSDKGATDPAPRAFDGIDMLSWRTENAAFVVVGPADSPRLEGMAAATATRI